MNKPKIMIVDDDQTIIYAIKQVIHKEGYTCIEACNGKEAIEKTETEKPNLAFMDIVLPDMDGLEAMQQIKQKYSALPVIVITGHGNMQKAIKAMQLEAFDYLTKPLSVKKVRDALGTALSQMKRTEKKPNMIDKDFMNRHALIGKSDAMQEIYKLIGMIATTPNNTSVLITGESGTGKELVARAIHDHGAHSNEPFIPINCTAFPETLLESELFGHEKGAFTGAIERKQGKFEVAGNGTIFLDEIGDLPLNTQQKLLRVLQEREFERLGGNTVLPIRARFIAATNQDIPKKIKQGEFREDLFYRLEVAVIKVPPLREHPEDIELLAYFFLERYNRKLNKSIKAFSEESMDMLQSYPYPGNVRELEHLIEQAVMRTKGEQIRPETVDKMSVSPEKNLANLPIVSPVFSESRNYLLKRFEKQFITEKLAEHRGNISEAAKESKMSRQNFYRLMEKHKIQPDNLK